MKHKWIVISLSVIFFLTALTFYANRVIFPTVIKKIAIEQAEKFFKRKVELESLHFNWLRGVVVNRVKIYQTGSSEEILAQAERISIGIIFIPGFKQHKLIFPFVNVTSPSLHVIHYSDDTWNFSDLLAAPVPDPNEKPAPVTVSVGSINLTNGKVRLDDLRPGGTWSEQIDQINLKIGLSLEGISFNGSLVLPQKEGFIGAQGAYQPFNQSLKSSLTLKNITPLDYLALIPVKLPFTLKSGTIKDVQVDLDYAPERMNVQGNWSIKNIDVALNDQSIKTDMDVSKARIFLNKNSISLKGLYTLANTTIISPAFSATGILKADITDCLINSPEDMSAKGNLSFEQASIIMSNEQSIKGDFKFDHIQILKDKNATAANLAFSFNSLDIRMPGQTFKGNLNTRVFAINIDNQNNITASGPLDLTDMQILSGKNIVKGALQLKTLKASFDQAKQTLDTQLQGNLQNATIGLDQQGTLKGDAHFDLHVLYPLNQSTQLEYNGSLSVADALFEGLPFGSLKDINVTADIKTDVLTIQHLSLNVLDTAIKASGNITHFAKPLLDVQIESERFDLSKIKTAAPDLLQTYGLTVDGEAAFKVKFQGLASDALNGQFNALATLKKVNVLSASGKFENISGVVKADGDSLSWEDFTAIIMEQQLSSSGTLTDFKNPKIKASAIWNGLDLKAQIHKNGNLINILNITGNYLTAATFNAQGSVDLESKTPILNIETKVQFKLEDLKILLPALKPNLEPLKLSGSVTASSSVKGPASNWKAWDSTASAQSDLISIAGFKFNNVAFDLAQGNSKLNKFNITSKLYEGDLNIVTTADLTDPAISFETALHVENVNLAKLKNDTGAKDEDLRGFIALTTVVKGTLQNILELTGKGALNISQGYLMKKEFSSLFMIPELSNLTFTEATANFEIANQTVSTENFALKSEGAILNGKGTIGFDHTIQMEMHPEFNVDAIAQSESMRRGPSALIASAAGKYLTFTVTGTLEKPVIRTIKKPTELIKKTGEILKENVGQILQGLFE